MLPLQEYLAGIDRSDRESEVQRIAAEVGVSSAAFRHWANGTRKVPGEKVLVVEKATGVSRYSIRPDIFGPSPDEAA